jgi:hypothetical protein
MATYTTRARIGPDHRLTVEVPRDLPVGEAEVTVVVESTPVMDEVPNSVALLAWLRERRARPKSWTPMTRDEIDAYIEESRDETERDLRIEQAHRPLTSNEPSRSSE